MGKVDIEELKKLNYEEGAELLALVGYVESDETTADASGISEFVRDNYWKLFDEDGEAVDTVSWVEYFNILKHNAGDLDDEEIIRAGWERMEYVE
jgi:hypothetical protein